MLRVSDLDACVHAEFGARLHPHGLEQSGQRRWVRESKLPVREIFTFDWMKGGTYCPVWGFSSGLAPARRGRKFMRVSTARDAVMDLRIHPVDETGDVPRATFSFLTGYDESLPVKAIRRCADRFVPRALSDFDRVGNVADLLTFFAERSRARTKRLPFLGYVPHALMHGFCLLLQGSTDAGMEAIHRFCQDFEMDPRDKVLVEYVHEARSRAASAADASNPPRD